MNKEQLRLIYLLEHNCTSENSFNFKNYWEKNNDFKKGMVVEEADHIKYDYEKDLFEIRHIQRIIGDFSEYSYSSYPKETNKEIFNYEELKVSNYYEDVIKRFEDCKTINIDYVVENYEEPEFKCTDNKLSLKYYNNDLELKINTITKEIKIATDCNDYYGKISNLRICDKEEYDELIKAKAIYDYITNNVLEFKKIENGYIIDNVFFENFEEYINYKKKIINI